MFYIELLKCHRTANVYGAGAVRNVAEVYAFLAGKHMKEFAENRGALQT